LDLDAVEAAVLAVLRPLNQTLDELAAQGWIVTLHPAGHVYEARIVTDQGMVVLRPAEDDLPP
jgi:hypothetical protein